MATTILELQRNQFFPQLFASESLTISRVTATSFRFAGFLWRNIGEGASEDRSSWSRLQWHNHLSSPTQEFYAVYCDGEPAGCCEISRGARLMQSKGGTARVEAFGLLPEFVGEGLGPALLTRVVEKALATGATRVMISSGAAISPQLLRMCRSQGFKVLSSNLRSG